MEQWELVINNNEMPAYGQKTYIWGAGNTAVLAHQGMLRENLYEELGVDAFLDSKLAGSKLFDIPVYHPNVLDKCDPEKMFVLICTTNQRIYHEIRDICRQKNISCCLLDAAVLKVKREAFYAAAELLDSYSTEIYHAVLKNRAEAETTASLFAGDSYFGIPEFCISDARDVVLDCGAYVGDSAERFIWRMEQFKKYIAIEPDKDNFLAMEKRFDRLRGEWNFSNEKLTALNVGVDETTGNMDIESRVDGLGSIPINNVEGGSEGIQFWAIDDLIDEPYTFLKADIESYEYKMICGAQKSIRKYHPRMAICIYHNMIDMYSIPLLIHKIDPTYNLAVRHHSFGYEETVLYAY